jgi:hypothetical protein
MDEQTAQTKWCPFSVVRGKDTPAAAVNRLTGRDDQCTCLGSGCACWRVQAGVGWCGLAGDKGVP